MTESLQKFPVFIKNLYGLQVAVRCSSDVDDICQKNCVSFCELLRPFSQISSENQLRDHQGHPYTVRDVRVRLSEPNSEPMAEVKLHQLLSSVVRWSETGSGPRAEYGNVTTNATAPWFDHYREKCIENMSVLEHEFFRYYMAVMLVVSTRQPKPMDVFSNLHKAQKEAEQAKYPYWISSHHLFYYHILLHDNQEASMQHAQECYEQMKASYGAGNSFFLHINSRDPDSASDSSVPEPWSQFLQIPPLSAIGEEETDFPVKLRLRRKKNKSSKSSLSPYTSSLTPSSSPNQSRISPKPSPRSSPRSSPRVPSTNHTPSYPSTLEPPLSGVRVEASITTEKEREDEDKSSSSSTSTSVEFGQDPLTQAEDSTLSEGGREMVGQYMSLQDQQNLRNLVKEFISRLLPHLEAVLRKLNESVQKKRSVSRKMSSFFRQLGGGAMFATGAGPSNNHDGSLDTESVDWLMRQVGDMAILLQNYDLAMQTHLTLKRDLQGKDSWLLHYAGASEMVAVSGQMMGSSRREVQSFLDEAIGVYNNYIKKPALATRPLFLLCEVLKERRQYKDLSQYFIKMISDDADLRSALCLEQAAHAFLKASMTRKYLFHLILSAHHYSRASQKTHAARTFKQALQLYQGNGWTIAEDFAQYSLSRICYNLGQLAEMKDMLRELLSHDSQQNAAQQLANVKDYINIHRLLMTQSDPSIQQRVRLRPPHSTISHQERLHHVPCLPLPFIDPQQTLSVFCTGQSNPSCSWLKQVSSPSSLAQIGERSLSFSRSSRGDSSGALTIGAVDYNPIKWRIEESSWHELEKICAITDDMEGFQPAVLFMGLQTDNSVLPSCPLNEPVVVSFSVRNPLAIPLHMSNVTAVWEFTPLTAGEPHDNAAMCEVLDKFIVSSQSQATLSLQIVPIKTGDLMIKGIVYNLCVSESSSSSITHNASCEASGDPNLLRAVFAEGVQGRVNFECRGSRLNNTKAERLSATYAPDHRLHWRVIGLMPKLLVTMHGLRGWVMAGELCSLQLEATNCGQVPLVDIRMNSSLNHCLLLQKSSSTSPIYSPIASSAATSSIHHIPPPAPPFLSFPQTKEGLLPDHSSHCNLLLHAPLSSSSSTISGIMWQLVFYYQSALNSSDLSHRVLRHCEPIRVVQCLNVKATAAHSSQTRLSTTDPSQVDMDQLLISLDIENIGRAMELANSDLSVTQVTTISRTCTTQLIRPHKQDFCLLPGESGMLHLKASRSVWNSKKSEDKSIEELYFSDMPLGDKNISSHSFPVAHLLSQSELYQKLRFQSSEEEKEERGFGDSYFDEKKSNNDDGKKAYSADEEMLVVVFWEATSQTSHGKLLHSGHHVITVTLPQSIPLVSKTPTPTTAQSLVSSSPYDLVKYHMSCPATLKHDFVTSKMCVVTVSVLLKNSCSSSVVVSLNTQSSSEVSVGSRSLEPSFTWSGPCTKNLQIEPLSSQTVVLYANFTTPGHYCLSTLKVKAALRDGSRSSTLERQQWYQPCYISIEQLL